MATSNDHPGLPFVQAEGYTRGRGDGPPLWIVIHTMEAGENSQRAESTANYFANPPDGRQVSSHYCADNDSVVQCVDLDDVAWTVGNRPGNYRGINWELSGFASQTRELWLDSFGRSMLSRAAPLMRSDMARFGIPMVRCSVADLQARRKGFTTHNDLRLAFGVTTHTDPGPHFPFDILFDLIVGPVQEHDMPMYVVERQANGFQQVWASTGVHRWHVTDMSQVMITLGIPFPTQIVTTKQLVEGYGIDVSVASPPLTPGELQQVADAARNGAIEGVDAAFDGATITTTIDTSN